MARPALSGVIPGAVRALILRFVLACVFGAAWMSADGCRERIAGADAIVVLGSKVEPSGQPAKRLVARLQRGLELWRAGYAPVVIVSSGINPRGVDEAAVMRQWLLARGMPDSAVVADASGRNTWATGRFVARWLTAHEGSRVIAVSQYFHLTRCRLTFRRYGVPWTGTACARHVEWRDAFALPRDVVGLVQYALRPAPPAVQRYAGGGAR